jgi:hypothetical protein
MLAGRFKNWLLLHVLVSRDADGYLSHEAPHLVRRRCRASRRRLCWPPWPRKCSRSNQAGFRSLFDRDLVKYSESHTRDTPRVLLHDVARAHLPIDRASVADVSPDGERAMEGSDDGEMLVLDLAKGRPHRRPDLTRHHDAR